MSGLRDALGHFVRRAEAAPASAGPVAEPQTVSLAAALAVAERAFAGHELEQHVIAGELRAAQARRDELLKRQDVDAVAALDEDVARLQIVWESLMAAAPELSARVWQARQALWLAEQKELEPAIDAARAELGEAAARMLTALDRLRALQSRHGGMPVEPDATLINLYRIGLWMSWRRPPAQLSAQAA